MSCCDWLSSVDRLCASNDNTRLMPRKKPRTAKMLSFWKRGSPLYQKSRFHCKVCALGTCSEWRVNAFIVAGYRGPKGSLLPRGEGPTPWLRRCREVLNKLPLRSVSAPAFLLFVVSPGDLDLFFRSPLAWPLSALTPAWSALLLLAEQVRNRDSINLARRMHLAAAFNSVSLANCNSHRLECFSS
jgi:hypothetical protein